MFQKQNINVLIDFLFADSQKRKQFQYEIGQFMNIDWKGVYSFFTEHAIVPFTSDLVSLVPEDYCELKNEWKKAAFTNIYTFSLLVKHQEQILSAFSSEHIPVVVLKGTSAAQYYPKPHLRTMGDVDLLVKPDDYDKAVELLLSIGSVDITGKAEAERGRHRSFHYAGISIELHHFFSSLINADKAPILDRMLFDAIPDNSTILPKEENGLVLLNHIAQHIEGGLGLRQIIDWMMYVQTSLNDAAWYTSFQKKTQILGLEKLALSVTKMCQMHLGLTTTNITWCESAEDSVCDVLLQYVFDCGNFGKSEKIKRAVSERILPSLVHPIQLLKFMQSRGEVQWKALKKHPNLKPFAWIYQSCRYTKMAVQNKVGIMKMQSIYAEGAYAARRNHLDRRN